MTKLAVFGKTFIFSAICTSFYWSEISGNVPEFLKNHDNGWVIYQVPIRFPWIFKNYFSEKSVGNVPVDFSLDCNIWPRACKNNSVTLFRVKGPGNTEMCYTLIYASARPNIAVQCVLKPQPNVWPLYNIGYISWLDCKAQIKLFLKFF